METARVSRLIPLAKTHFVGVVINLDCRDCAGSVRYLNAEAARYGFLVDYLLVNPNTLEIPQWALRDGMSVLNYKQDFDGECRFLTGTAEKFWSRERDYLITISDSRFPLIEIIAGQASAGFKIGREASGNDRIYDLTVRIGRNDREENLAMRLLSSLKVLTREIDQREDENL